MDNQCKNIEFRSEYVPPQVTVVELRADSPLLQGSAVKQDYQDGGDIVWN